MDWFRSKKDEGARGAELEATKRELEEMTAAHAQLQVIVGDLPTEAPTVSSTLGLRDYPQNVVSWLQTWWGGALWVVVPLGNLLYDVLKGSDDVNVVAVLVWCAVGALGPPAVLNVRIDALQANWYRLSAALAGIILGLLAVFAPPLAFSAAGVVALLSLYGGKQIGRYAAHQDIRKALDKSTPALDQGSAGSDEQHEAQRSDDADEHTSHG